MSLTTIAVYALALVVVVFLLAILNPIRFVQQDQRGVIERFGEYHRYADPGLHILLPFIERMERRDITEQMRNVAPSDMITKDNLNANVDLDVYYRVMPNEKDVKKSFYEVENYDKQITRLAQTTARDIIGRKNFETVNSDRSELNRELYEELDEETEQWGIDVVRVEMKEITPPEDVQDSMNEIIKAENEKDAAEDFAHAEETKADGERRAEIKKAEGKKQAAILEAEGNAQAVVKEAKAKADKIKLENTALRNHFKNEAQEWKKLSTVENSLKNGSKYIIDSESEVTPVLSEVGGVTPIDDQDWGEGDSSSDELDLSTQMEEVSKEAAEKVEEVEEEVRESV